MNRKLKIVAVTKGRSAEEILALLKKIPIQGIAENRLEEAEKKFPDLPKNLEKHFLGKLQSRKIKKIVELFDVIQSVENLKQAELVSEAAGQMNKTMKIFLQVNISEKTNRSGCQPQETSILVEKIKKLPHLKLLGVMGMAKHDPKSAQKEFQLLKSLQNGLPECSMGMSDDYKIALKEGSTLLRLGRLLFQEPLPKLQDFE